MCFRNRHGIEMFVRLQGNATRQHIKSSTCHLNIFICFTLEKIAEDDLLIFLKEKGHILNAARIHCGCYICLHLYQGLGITNKNPAFKHSNKFRNKPNAPKMRIPFYADSGKWMFLEIKNALMC